MINFTGSTGLGRKLSALCGKHLKYILIHLVIFETDRQTISDGIRREIPSIGPTRSRRQDSSQ
jgi:hypothetical protein